MMLGIGEGKREGEKEKMKSSLLFPAPSPNPVHLPALLGIPDSELLAPGFVMVEPPKEDR